MTQTESPTTAYRVTLTDGGTRIVQAVSKEAAGEIALDQAAAAARSFNVMFATSLLANGLSWGLADENRSALAVRSIRKAPTRH